MSAGIRKRFVFDESEQGPEYSEHSGQMVTVGGYFWNTRGDEMTEEEAYSHRFATGDVLRFITADDGWQAYAWESELR